MVLALVVVDDQRDATHDAVGVGREVDMAGGRPGIGYLLDGREERLEDKRAIVLAGGWIVASDGKDDAARLLDGGGQRRVALGVVVDEQQVVRYRPSPALVRVSTASACRSRDHSPKAP